MNGVSIKCFSAIPKDMTVNDALYQLLFFKLYYILASEPSFNKNMPHDYH
jgi:hypothetical protein